MVQEKFQIEYFTYQGGPIYTTKPINSFGEAQKYRELLLSQGKIDPVIKKACKVGYGLLSNPHSTPTNLRKQSLV